jgi:hypothetical protein
MMQTVYHADLSDAHPGEDYWLNALGKRYEFVPHTPESLDALKSAAPHLLNGFPGRQLTHYTQERVELPAECVVRVHIKNTLRTFPQAQGKHGIGHVAIHCPPPPDKLQAMQDAGEPHQAVMDYLSDARALIFHHPDLINNDPGVTGIIDEYMDSPQIDAMFQSVAMQMRVMGQPTETSGWARLEPFTPEPNPDTHIPDETFYFAQPTLTIIEAAGSVATAMMKATKNDVRLEGKKWEQQTGLSVEDENGPDQLTLAARIQTESGDDWRASLTNTREINGFKIEIPETNSAEKKVKLKLTNFYIRYLGAYIRFYDADGNAMSVPEWRSDNFIANLITEVINIQYDDLRFIGQIQPINNIMAIPIAADPGKLEVTIEFPPDAVSASIYGAGLGTGSNPWPKTPIVGGILTGVLNLGVPAFMLAFAVAAQSYKPLYDIIEELSANKKFVGAVIAGGVVFFGGQFSVGAAHREMDWKAFSTLAKLLFDKAATKALIWVEAQTLGGEIVNQIPFAGWIVIAINIATGIAQIAQTIVAVATSPWNIQNQLATSITTNVTLSPDPRHHAFPQAPAGSQASYSVKMIYKDQTRPTVSQTHEVPAGSTAPTLPAAFPNNTLGGQVKFEVSFFIDEWVAAKATTGWMQNDESHVSQVDLYLIQYPVPLNDKSVYLHTALLTYQNGAYVWQPTPTAPTATIAARNTSSTGNAISEWMGLTLSQRYGMIGFAWKAAGMGINSCASGQGTGQLFAMQNINIPGIGMSALKFPNCGFDGPTQIVYDPFPPKFLMQDGQWVLVDGKPVVDPNSTLLGEYYVDPRKSEVSLNEGGGYHMRRVTLDNSTPFDTRSGQLSWGRFAYFPNSVALHPSGNVIGVNTQYKKIQVAKLVSEGVADKDMPVAEVYAGEALKRDRRGLLFRPLGVTCAYDGTIFVLEDTKSAGGAVGLSFIVARVQAFDLYGNPVNRFFDNEGKPSPFLYLSEAPDFNYLDIVAVGDEKMTYLYVLFYTGDGGSPSDYHMSIYQYGTKAPVKNPLVMTDNVAAARIAVDMWHTMYALNYDMVTDGQGHHAGPHNSTTGPAGRTVPSVSEWLPPVPKEDEA